MMKDPVFIVGHSRSGSTLLASVLDRHSNIYSIPETHFCSASYSGNFIKRWFSRRSVESLVEFTLRKNIRLKDTKFSESDVIKHLKKLRKPREKDVLDAIFASVLNGRSETRVVEKTPFHIEHIDRLLSWYPDSKIIFILRDGRDAIQSLMNVPWTHDNPQKHAAYWSWCVRESRRKIEMYPTSVIAIRYEDLITNPHGTLKKLFGFIGEEYQDSIILSDNSTNAIPEWESDWKSASAKNLDPEMAYKWKKSKSDKVKEWGQWLHNELNMLDYPDGEKNSSKLALRYRYWLFSPMYKLWLFYRTHGSERKSKFRRSMK